MFLMPASRSSSSASNGPLNPSVWFSVGVEVTAPLFIAMSCCNFANGPVLLVFFLKEAWRFFSVGGETQTELVVTPARGRVFGLAFGLMAVLVAVLTVLVVIGLEGRLVMKARERRLSDDKRERASAHTHVPDPARNY